MDYINLIESDGLMVDIIDINGYEYSGILLVHDNYVDIIDNTGDIFRNIPRSFVQVINKA